MVLPEGLLLARPPSCTGEVTLVANWAWDIRNGMTRPISLSSRNVPAHPHDHRERGAQLDQQLLGTPNNNGAGHV